MNNQNPLCLAYAETRSGFDEGKVPIAAALFGPAQPVAFRTTLQAFQDTAIQHRQLLEQSPEIRFEDSGYANLYNQRAQIA